MEQFVNEKNLAHFRKRLAETTDRTERQMIWKLLAEEKAKQRGRVACDRPLERSQLTTTDGRVPNGTASFTGTF